jgi:hypothetical protein
MLRLSTSATQRLTTTNELITCAALGCQARLDDLTVALREGAPPM